MKSKSLWAARHSATSSLEGELKSISDLLQASFDLADDCIERLVEVDKPFARVTALFLIKARNLTLGSYSLCLDGLGQEGGGLFRPLIEAYELLIYFRSDPTRIREALEGRLPKAGVVAKRIDGKFKALREHLNTHASHLSMSAESLLHLLDLKERRLRPVQPHNVGVLRQNLSTLLMVWNLIGMEAVNCVSVATEKVDHALANKAESIKKRIMELTDAGLPPNPSPDQSTTR